MKFVSVNNVTLTLWGGIDRTRELAA